MIYVSADGVNRCKPLLIFKGQDGPKNSRIRKEMIMYDPGVIVQCGSHDSMAKTAIQIRYCGTA